MSIEDDKSPNETERRRLESLGALTPGIIHEFNNLLNIFVGNLGLIEERIHGDELLSQCIEDMHDASQRAARLCRLVQSQASGNVGEVSTFELNSLVEESATLVQAAFLKGAKLDLQLTPDLPELARTGPELRQALTTLLLNAAAPVMRQDATVEVRTALASEEDRAAEEVWEPLRGSEGKVLMVEAWIQGGEVENASPLEREGLEVPGFALSSAREIVRSLGGDLCWVESPSRGRRLRLLISCNGKAAAQAARQTASADRVLTFEGTVLVVDDEKSSRKVIGTILERLGSMVLAASSGEEALSIYEKHGEQIALVMLDMSMPGLGGKETFRRLSALDENVKVLVMSGYDEGTGLDGLKKEEVLGYLQKPFRLQGLKDKLVEILPGLS